MKRNRVLPFLVGIKAGAVLAMLFAQRPGKELRTHLKHSKHPVRDFIKEGWEIDKEIFRELNTAVKESESFDKVMTLGKKHLDVFSSEFDKLSEKAKKEALGHLEHLKEVISDSVKDLKNRKAVVTKKVMSRFENEAEAKK